MGTAMPELVSISTSNRKTGTASISLPPGLSCIPEAPCFDPAGCYAWKMYFNTTHTYTNCRAAWDRNLRIYQENPAEYWRQIRAWLTKHNPPYFRWHVSGDFPDYEYFLQVLATAAQHPETQFTFYTKRYRWLVNSPSPRNQIMWASGWPGLPIPDSVRTTTPVFWMYDPENPDPRIPDSAFACPGSCPECRVCWDDTIKDVVNKKH